MASVYFDPAVGGDGSTVTDDTDPSTGLGNGGHRTRFIPALSQSVAVASTTVNETLKAKDWAIKLSGTVDGSEYSSKEYASGTFVPTGSAKEWSIHIGTSVDGSEFSAKEYAVGVAIRGVSGKGSSKDWATYTAGTVDGTGYSAKKHATDAGSYSVAAATSASTANTHKNAAAVSEANALGYSNSAQAAWSAALAANPDLNPAFRMNPSTILTDAAIASGYNAVSAGPLTIGEGVTVTLNDNSNWSIV